MEKQLFKDMSPQERVQMLSDNAERRESFTYLKDLTPDEVTELKDEFTSESILLAKLEEEKKAIMDEFKAKIKPVKKEMARMISLLRTRSEEVEESVYLLADQEEGMMGYYNAQGELVNQRRLRQNEKQMRILNKAQ